ncbi:hypothetical protein CSKR_200558 [Clonorchis sinensis]|uniref:Uncharacterized protein n=1 Tax=Clonorchis sinensis TaxID=79923 RepID=A0A8T1MFC6_CLOSI|nr:hypothetical protein CSKR_200558 [Clonorchis sinensis]
MLGGFRFCLFSFCYTGSPLQPLCLLCSHVPYFYRVAHSYDLDESTTNHASLRSYLSLSICLRGCGILGNIMVSLLVHIIVQTPFATVLTSLMFVITNFSLMHLFATVS